MEFRVLLRDGEVGPLTAKVFNTLIVLVQSHRRVLEKSALLAALWPDTKAEDANLTQNILTLPRGALGNDAKHHQHIATIPGRGYSFVGKVTAVEPIGEPDSAKLLREPSLGLRWRPVLIGVPGDILLLRL